MPRDALERELALLETTRTPVLQEAAAPGKVDVAQAVRLNRAYARDLGWGKLEGRVGRLLGFDGHAPSPQAFAQAVHQWQMRAWGAGAADGILGPRTWAALRPKLAAAPPGPPGTPAAGTAPDLARAVVENRRLRRELGWAPHAAGIASVTGWRGHAADEAGFAQAVATWQRANASEWGLSDSGMVDGATWRAFKAHLGLGPNAKVQAALPAPAPGLVPYGRPHRQYGRLEAIQALLTVGRRWAERHAGGPRIGIGDISFRTGGLMPPHKSHQAGLDVDIRPMRADGAEAGTVWSDPSTQYSRARTQELVDLLRQNGVLQVEMVLFNDPAVTGVRRWPGHDNHLHV
ncbi:MAG: penicillin-insensitive murein endopeptidase, partial [Halobacteriales archaeon]|nr:penicillin-insensitive murein endopeptidase [Halobacteriales archaeon]